MSSKLSKSTFVASAEAVTWKDRKQVALYNNFGVRPFEDGDTVPRHVTGESERQPIPCPACVIAYNKYMGAVDRKDRDTSDWGIDVRSVRWYLSIFYWLINSTLANMFCIHSQQQGFSQKYGVLASNMSQPLPWEGAKLMNGNKHQYSVLYNATAVGGGEFIKWL